ncbi:hypothetical protein LZ31DRAFT_424526, partial [Colletotrichum somersetense]
MDLYDDVAIDTVKIQESILSLEPGTQQTQIIVSDDEVRARLSALVPPWSRHQGPTKRLREAVGAIPLATNVPAPGVAEEGLLSEFPQLMPADVVEEFAKFSFIFFPPRPWARYPRMRLRTCEGERSRREP